MVGGHGGIVKPVANVFRSKGGVYGLLLPGAGACRTHPASARNLVGDGLVTDIALDPGSLEEHGPVLRLDVVTPSACSKGPSRQASLELQ
jgi:hypothetical protein